MENSTDASIIELPKLQEMRFVDLPNLAAFSQGVEIVDLPQITTVEIFNCPKLRFKIGKWNIKLQKLTIWKNDAIEEILWGDEIRDEGERHIIFPELLCLELLILPRLTTFCKGVESIKFPKLEKMKIGGLARMNSLLLPLDSEATNDQHCLHFFCNQKVEISGLVELKISDLKDNISNIWCHRVPINFFHNLKTLRVYDLVDITNLMSFSIAKNLVNLDDLDIWSCQGMFIVIVGEKEIFEFIRKQEEVFVTSLFPKLRKLSISNLPKLKSFCHWENAFELPSLQEVHIQNCPMMKTFTWGSASAPKLSTFRINNEPTEGKDLNEGIREHFMTKISPMMETFTLGSVSAPKLSTFHINYEPTEEGKDLNEGIRDHFMTEIEDDENEEQVTFSQPEKGSPSYDFLETTECLAEQRNDGNSMRIADPAPQASEISLSHHESTLEFESRRCIEEDISEFELRRRINVEDIMESLNDDHVHAIAVCGTGDAERTTMLRRIEDKARNTLFDEVVMVVVGQQNDLLKIQKEIAELLGLEFSHEDTPARRAYKLFIRLLDSKRKLIIFDDVWKSFKLEDIGVPFGNGFKDCKIILASRVKQVCEEMGAYKVVQIEDVHNVPEEMNTECLPFFKCSDICNIYKRLRTRTSEEGDEE